MGGGAGRGGAFGSREQPLQPRLPCPQLMMEQSKKSSLMVARSILNNKLISKKLERYLKVRRAGASAQALCGPGPAGLSALQ